MSDDIYDGVDGQDVANLYDELYTLATDYANAKSTEQAKFKKKYPKKYGTIRRLLVNEIHSSNKAEGGIVGLFMGGSAMSGGGFSDADIGDAIDSVGSGSDNDNDNDYFTEEEDSARGGDYTTDDSGKFTGYGESYGESIQDSIDKNPQLKGYLGKQIKNLVDKGKVREFEFDKDGRITGVYSSAPQLPGIFGGLASLLGLSGGKVYTGYGKGSEIPDTGGDSGEEPSKMIRKIVEEKKKEDTPLTEAELDYFGRGLGTASKPMKTLADINEFIGGLYSDTTSPIGATLSKDKRFLTLPNGKVIDLRTGREVEKMQGLELFKGGRI